MENKNQNRPIGPTRGASPLRWRFMDQSDARLSEWGSGEEIDVSPIDGEILERLNIRPQAWRYYERLRAQGVCPPLGQDGARLCFMDEAATVAVIMGVSLTLGVIAGEVQSKWETKTQAIEFYDFFLLSTASRCKMFPGVIMSALYLEGLLETIDAGHPLHAYVFELLMHRAKGVAATRPTPEELAELTPFLDFLAETEAGKAVQSELMAGKEAARADQKRPGRPKDHLIDFIADGEDKDKTIEVLKRIFKGKGGVDLSKYVALAIGAKKLKDRPSFAALKEIGALGTRQGYESANTFKNLPTEELNQFMAEFATLERSLLQRES